MPTEAERQFHEAMLDIYRRAKAEARLDSAKDFTEWLTRVEAELTTPEEDVVQNPAEAKSGDRLRHGFTVKARLGRGSTAVALLVERDGATQVLKVASDPANNDRLHGEAEILRKLRHQYVVRLDEELDFDGRVGLLMERAGQQTLAQRLRQEGPLHLELLQRFGDDLLTTVDWLEQQGIPHRDIKPENVGIAKIGRGDQLHLVLFDFSLSRTPPEAITAGTVPYLDPFIKLRKPPRWDLHAERFAAAMTLYEMTTGRLPIWGDGRSDPAVVDYEVTLDVGRFDPNLRDEMVGFFSRAQRRNADERFDNAEQMLQDWRRLFRQTSSRVTRREAYSQWLEQTARDFLADPTRRAIVHPAPTARMCQLATSRGPIYFYAKVGSSVVRQVPLEAYRRFQNDLRIRRGQTEIQREHDVAINAERRRLMEEWVAKHGTPDQRERFAAGSMARSEWLASAADCAFGPLAQLPAYDANGARTLQAFLRQLPAYAGVVVTYADYRVITRPLTTATPAQWEWMQWIRRLLPDANVHLRERELIWNADSRAPRHHTTTLLVTTKVGALTLRREFAVPEAAPAATERTKEELCTTA